jgi:hypothetical protein
MSLRHGWGWQPSQIASHIHIRHIKNIWEYWYIVHGHELAALNSIPSLLGSVLGVLGHLWSQIDVIRSCFWLTLTANSNCFLHPHWTYIKRLSILICCPWAYGSTSNSYTQLTWVIIWGSGSLVESKWCHYVMVEADSQLKLLPTFILDVYKVFEHIGMLSVGIRH